MDNMDFGQRMMIARKERKLSQAEIGERSGINPDIVGKYERGENVPSIGKAKMIAEALDVSLDYLVGIGKEAQEIDNKTLSRLIDIGNLESVDKSNILYTLDALIKAAKLKSL